MLYISKNDQATLQTKINRLPSIFRKETFTIVFFETFGAFVFLYGCCTTLYLHPIDKRILNPVFDFLVSCFYYFALSIAGPFSGGHLNPAITLCLSRVEKNKYIYLYIIGQIIGSFLGCQLAYAFFGVVPMAYVKTETFSSLLIDGISEAFGAFVFSFFFLMVTQTNYMAGQYYRYFVLSVLLYASRIFTLRKQVVNPAAGFIVQVFSAWKHSNVLLFMPYSLPLVIGPLCGALAAPYFFTKIYQPLKVDLEEIDKEMEEEANAP